MLLDDNTVLLDSAPVQGAAVTGKAIALNALQFPGRSEPIPVTANVSETFAGGTSITFKLTQSDTQDGTYTDVPASSVTLALVDLTKGKTIGWRYLPFGTSKPWLKMVATPTGTFTAGKVFAAVVREDDQPYAAGMYIDKGVVKG